MWDRMKQRVLTGVLLALTTLALVWIGGTVLSVAVAGMICLGVYEEFHALAQAGHRPVSWPTWAGVALLVLMGLLGVGKYVIPLILLICILTVARVIFRKDPRLEDAAMSLLPLFTVLLPGMCMIGLVKVSPRQLQWTLIAVLVIVPCMGDIFAMQVGSRVGGPKLCPEVSPNKTVSGAIGGLCGSLLSAILVGIAAMLLCRSEARALLPHWTHYLLLGLIGGVASQLGDLCFSLIKRHSGIKDYSHLFPGHGGMLDRLDSVLFMSLVVFCYYLLVYM